MRGLSERRWSDQIDLPIEKSRSRTQPADERPTEVKVANVWNQYHCTKWYIDRIKKPWTKKPRSRTRPADERPTEVKVERSRADADADW